MSRSEENRGFVCVVCARQVMPLTNGSYRNHCPFCLSSLHVDVRPGDRAASCGGVMDGIGIRRAKKGWQIIQRCRRCGLVRPNRIAADDPQPDDIDTLTGLLRRGTPAVD